MSQMSQNTSNPIPFWYFPQFSTEKRQADLIPFSLFPFPISPSYSRNRLTQKNGKGRAGYDTASSEYHR